MTKYKFVRSTIGVTCYTHQLEAPLGDGGKGRVVQTFECIQLCHAQLLEAGALQSGGDYRSSNAPVAGRQLKLPATLPWQVLCDAQRYGGWVAALAQAHGCRLPMAFQNAALAHAHGCGLPMAFQNAALAHAHGCGLPMAFQNVRKMSAPDAGGQGEYKYNLSTKPIEVTSFRREKQVVHRKATHCQVADADVQFCSLWMRRRQRRLRLLRRQGDTEVENLWYEGEAHQRVSLAMAHGSSASACHTSRKMVSHLRPRHHGRCVERRPLCRCRAAQRHGQLRALEVCRASGRRRTRRCAAAAAAA